MKYESSYSEKVNQALISMLRGPVEVVMVKGLNQSTLSASNNLKRVQICHIESFALSGFLSLAVTAF